MLNDARKFNQPLNSWQTSSATSMEDMFKNTRAFNQNIDSWQTENVTNFADMFNSASAYGLPLGSWQTGTGADVDGMLYRSNCNRMDSCSGNCCLSNTCLPTAMRSRLTPCW